jgi:vacuolar-type H+-ATPase subunit I/STV1
MNIENATIEELNAEIDRLNAEMAALREKTREQILSLTAERDRRAAVQEARNKWENLSEAERSALRQLALG